MNQPKDEGIAVDAETGDNGDSNGSVVEKSASEIDSSTRDASMGDQVEQVDGSHKDNPLEQSPTTTGHDEIPIDIVASTNIVESEASKILIIGELLAKLPDDLFIPPDALEVFLETFQGPLDLLLYLIRKQNLDILDIPVALITRQYMEYVELMRHFRLDLAAEYLVMAATLAEIKSRMLLPRPAGEEEDDEQDPRAILIRRLQEYERFSQAARDIDDRPRLERDLYLVNMEFDDPEPVKVQPRASLNDLVVAFRSVMDRTEQNKNWSVGHERLTVREKMTQILDRIGNCSMMRFEDLFDPQEGRLGLVVCFMAILELARDNMLIVVQSEPYAPIQMKRIESE